MATYLNRLIADGLQMKNDLFIVCSVAKIVCIALCLFQTTRTLHWDFETRFGLGPAWHQFSTYETYNLRPMSVFKPIASVEFVRTNYQAMIYFEGRTRWTCNNHFNINFYGGGGFFNKGQGSISYHTPFFTNQSSRLANAAANIALFDVGAGFKCTSKDTVFAANILAGYILNNQGVQLQVFTVPIYYQFSNKWRGGYIGAELDAHVTCNSLFCLGYKCVVGHVRSSTIYSAGRNIDIYADPTPPNAPLQYFKVPMFGNIFSLEVSYAMHPDWVVGMRAEYFKYRNYKNGRGGYDPLAAPYFDSLCLKQLIWQQVLSTFFVKLVF